MNNNKKIQLNTKTQWLRIALSWMFLMTIGTINYSCDNKCDNDIVPHDVYYVKYEVKSSTIYTGGKLDVIINTENNKDMTLIINKNALWETVIGPVQKGFNASLDVSSPTETYNKLKLYTNIYVSKNDSPFALKKSDGSDTPRDFVKINYTIDY